MKKIITSIFMICFFINTNANNGDTIHVVSHRDVLIQTDPGIGHTEYPLWAQFPASSTPIRKIMLKMTFKCPPGLRCGEWDYSNHIVMRRKGGVAGPDQNLEIAGFITPYGWNFPSSWKFEWFADLTDYESLLRDSVEIEYQHSGYEARADRGWLVTLDFIVTEGAPIMQTNNIQKLWDGNFRYGDLANDIETHLVPVSVNMNSQTKVARLHLLQTGHGGDGTTGCAEFCYPNRALKFDGGVVDVKQIYEPCGSIPLYPQGGTWIYDRGNWCPGMMVKPYIYDFNVAPSSNHDIDIDMDPYPSASGGAGNYVVKGHLIQFKEPATTNDLEVYEIKSPSSEYIYGRTGTVCSNPVITVRNNGKSNVTKFEIRYGIEGLGEFVQFWNGVLIPQEKIDITLHNILKPTATQNRFKAYVSYPNGVGDEYVFDDTLFSKAPVVPNWDSTIVFAYRTNLRSSENSYTLKDDLGNILYERTAGSLSNNTNYKDTFVLSSGCYTFHFKDNGGDGLSFWANSAAGNGTAKFQKPNNTLIKNYNPDFGNEIYQQFTVGDPEYRAVTGINELSNIGTVNVFPNPASDMVSIDCNFTTPQNIQVEILNLLGGSVYVQSYNNTSADVLDINTSSLSNGTYIVKIKSVGQEFTKKIFIQH
jgi:hypothetical protein